LGNIPHLVSIKYGSGVEGLVGPFETSLAAEPLVSLPVGVKAKGSEGMAKGAGRAPLVVVAAHDPLCFVAVTGIGPQAHDAFGAQQKAGVQEGIVSQTCISGDGLDDQIRVEQRQLEQERCGGILFSFVGRQKVIQEHNTEATLRVGELQDQTLVAVT